MISKKHPVEVLEQALKYEREQLLEDQKNIKTLKDQAGREEGQLMPTIARITGLEDAIHKLKGLDNLEKKNTEQRLPDSMAKNLLRVKFMRLYGRDILSFSQNELAAYIIHLEERLENILERKHR